MNHLNVLGVDEFFASIFKDSYSQLVNSNHCEILNGDADFLIEKFSKYEIFSHSFNLKNVFGIHLKEATYYILFVEIDLGHSFSNKYGQEDEGFEYQTWGFASLNRNFGEILVKPKEIQDKVSLFLLSLFGKASFDYKNIGYLNKKYSISGKKEDVNSFFTDDINRIILKVNDLNLLVFGKDVFIGFPWQITIDRVRITNELFKSIIDYIAKDV